MPDNYSNIIEGRKACFFIIRNGDVLAEHPSAESARKDIYSLIHGGDRDAAYEMITCEERHADHYRSQINDKS